MTHIAIPVPDREPNGKPARARAGISNVLELGQCRARPQTGCVDSLRSRVLIRSDFLTHYWEFTFSPSARGVDAHRRRRAYKYRGFVCWGRVPARNLLFSASKIMYRCSALSNSVNGDAATSNDWLHARGIWNRRQEEVAVWMCQGVSRFVRI